MRVEFTVRGTMPDDRLSEIQGYLETQRVVMVDFGGETRGIVGELVAAKKLTDHTAEVNQ